MDRKVYFEVIRPSQPMETENKNPVGTRAKRLTTRYGTKYEKASLLGNWATQISNGADPGVDLSKIPEKDRSRYIDPLTLAQKAFEDKTIPLIVRRYLPDGSFEDWTLQELTFE